MIERLAGFCNAENAKALTRDEWLQCYSWSMAYMTDYFRESSKRLGKPIHKHTCKSAVLVCRRCRSSNLSLPLSSAPLYTSSYHNCNCL